MVRGQETVFLSKFNFGCSHFPYRFRHTLGKINGKFNNIGTEEKNMLTSTSAGKQKGVRHRYFS